MVASRGAPTLPSPRSVGRAASSSACLTSTP
jgi:hypothetical protein